MRRFAVLLAVVAIVGMTVLPSTGAVSQFGCAAIQPLALEGVVPVAECDFTIECPFNNAGFCVVEAPHINVNGGGLVEGSMTFDGGPDIIEDMVCTGTFHCDANQSSTGGSLSPSERATVRCAGTGIAAVLTVSCSIIVGSN